MIQNRINNHASEGTVEILKKLLEDAKRGHLIGIAFIGILRGRQPIRGWAGYAGQDPYFTLGVLQHLNESLMEHAEQRGH